MKFASPSFFAGSFVLAFFFPTPAGAQPNVVSDVTASYDRMEQSIEIEFAKLKKQTKNDIDALDDKIKEMDRQIAALKDQANKIEKVAQKLEDLLPKIMAGIGSDSSGMRRTPSPKSDQFSSLLASERAKAGLPSTPGFPNLTPADLATAFSLPAANRPAFLSSLIAQQASRKISEIGNAIDAHKKESASLKAQIPALEKQIAELDADRQKALADLQKQKASALKSVPTATPTPIPKRG